MKRVLVSWSSGKDSAYMTHALRADRDVQLVALATTFNEAADRVAMHASRRTLVERQAAAMELPLMPIMLPPECSNEEYERRMRTLIDEAVALGVTHCAFGDLYLEDIRDYRIGQLRDTPIEPMFPIWCGEDGTAHLARTIIGAGFEAVLTCVDPKQIPESFVGRSYDAEFLADLPESVDPCGERGEFHTFCHAGPIYRTPLDVAVGEIAARDGFVFADVQ